MSLSNKALLLGDILDLDDIATGIAIKKGDVVVLHSGFGIEGVFTDSTALSETIRDLRTLSPYKNEQLSISTHRLNPSA